MRQITLLFPLALVTSCSSPQKLAERGNTLPYPPQEFKGKIGTSFEDSEEYYPQPYRAPEGTLNLTLCL